MEPVHRFGNLSETVGLLAVAVLSAIAGSASAETPLERGTYLMKSIVACGNCHTPKGPKGEIPGMELAGMTLQNAAYVRALGQIELVFTIIASAVFFREKIKRLELAGILFIVGGILILVLAG